MGLGKKREEGVFEGGGGVGAVDTLMYTMTFGACWNLT